MMKTQAFQVAVMEAFEHAYALGKSDAREGIHFDPVLLAEIYVEQLSHEKELNHISQLHHQVA